MEGMYLTQPSQLADKETGQGAETCPGPRSQSAAAGEKPGPTPRLVLPPLQSITRTWHGYTCFAEGKGDQT